MEYESRVNERQIQTTEEKTDTKSKEQDTSSRSGNDAHVDDADIRPIYDEEPMAEVQMTADDNVSATGQQHTEQPEFINEGEVDQNAEQCHDICPLPAKLTDDKTTELSNQSLESENVCLKKTVAQCQKDFAKLEAYCINLEIQMKDNVLKSGQQSQFLKEKSNEAKVKNDIDSLRTVLRWQPTGRILKDCFLSGFQLERHSPLAQQRLKGTLNGFQMQIKSPNHCEKANNALNVSAGPTVPQCCKRRFEPHRSTSVFMAMSSALSFQARLPLK
ncbi:hypothetical protein Tco_0337242 [Tanacetum coccineum]